MLVPRRVKYRKQMRGKMKGNATAGVKLSFGDFGLTAENMGTCLPFLEVIKNPRIYFFNSSIPDPPLPMTIPGRETLIMIFTLFMERSISILPTPAIFSLSVKAFLNK